MPAGTWNVAKNAIQYRNKGIYSNGCDHNTATPLACRDICICKAENDCSAKASFVEFILQRNIPPTWFDQRGLGMGDGREKSQAFASPLRFWMKKKRKQRRPCYVIIKTILQMAAEIHAALLWCLGPSDRSNALHKQEVLGSIDRLLSLHIVYLVLNGPHRRHRVQA
jgi:hypothetical protein